MKVRTFIATASLVASGSPLAFSGAAQAALYTACVGDRGAVTVSNDLVVPAGMSGTLTGTKVKGTMTVEAGADLVAAGATFNGVVTVEENACRSPAADPDRTPSGTGSGTRRDTGS
ncbi:hypothetical protein [Streptomyces sp. NPDC051286]|uniref:hypothetical protein n=1 Tax=Streptomyces sp. NPDC051286 TaxID=3365647 RepID=UPI00379FC9DD